MREKLAVACLAALCAGGCKGVLDLEEASYSPDADASADSLASDVSDSEADTGVADTETVDSSVVDSGGVVDTGAPPDTGPPPGDGGVNPPTVTFLFAAPDLPAQTVCVGAFTSASTTGTPVTTLDAISTSTTFGSATTAQTPMIQWDSDYVVIYSTNATTNCKSQWAIPADPHRSVTIPPKTLHPGVALAIAIYGCANPASANEACGKNQTAPNLAMIARTFSTTASSSDFALAFWDLTYFDGTNTANQAPQSWATGIDAWFVPFNGAGSPGTITQIATNAKTDSSAIAVGAGATLVDAKQLENQYGITVDNTGKGDPSPACLVLPPTQPGSGCPATIPWDPPASSGLSNPAPAAGKRYVVAFAGAPIGNPGPPDAGPSTNTLKVIVGSLDL